MAGWAIAEVCTLSTAILVLHKVLCIFGGGGLFREMEWYWFVQIQWSDLEFVQTMLSYKYTGLKLQRLQLLVVFIIYLYFLFYNSQNTVLKLPGL